jgi:hypothetical protein
MSLYAFFETVERFFERLLPARLRLLMLPTSEFFCFRAMKYEGFTSHARAP